MNFNGQTVFLTGAAHGIGRSVALKLAEGGASLVLCDINEKQINETAELARNKGAKVKVFILDVSDEKLVKNAVAETVNEFGTIDILINNAGIYNTYVPFVESTPDLWKKKIDINILGTLYPTHEIAPIMIKNGFGRIINIASVAGIYGISNMVDYSMTKGAILGFTKALAKELTPKGITVNCVSPGSIAVDDGVEMPNHSFMGRAGTPDECANVIVFLASKEASYVSGQNYTVDGCRKMM